MTVEKINELLLKNHDIKPTGSTAMLEAQANAYKSLGLEVVSANKIKVFEKVVVDPTYIIEITPKNKIVILVKSQQWSIMTYVIDVA